MKRFTRRCWSQPSYLMVAGCWTTFTLTSRTSAFRWADSKHTAHVVYIRHEIKKKAWHLRTRQKFWARLLFSFCCLYCSVCRSRPSVRKSQLQESPTRQQLSGLASQPMNLPPRKPKSKSPLTSAHMQHIPLLAFSFLVKHLLKHFNDVLVHT